MSRNRRRSARAPIAAAPARVRHAAIDALRGIGICLMVAYHFTFDLAYFRVVRIDFNHDPFWLASRALIVTIFLSTVGMSLVLARHANASPQAFWRRIALIAACAILVTIASYVTFPQTFITFGVLHAIAVCSVLAAPLLRYPRTALALGAAIVALGTMVQLPVFDQPWLNWVGMMTHKPATEDYVPIFPWLGVVLIGIAAGHAMLRPGREALAGMDRAAPGWLAWLGRHSLLIYMVHQPVLLGVLRVAL
jgi:uncharacterized membrane protein